MFHGVQESTLCRNSTASKAGLNSFLLVLSNPFLFHVLPHTKLRKADLDCDQCLGQVLRQP